MAIGVPRDPEADSSKAVPLAHEKTYWAATANIAGPRAPLTSDIDADVVIIGAGYTGLSTAYHLAKHHGIRAHVLEAKRIGWGCSGRNGGFAMTGIGKNAYSTWIKRYGIDGAKQIFQVGRDAVGTVRELIRENAIDAASPHEGWLLMAHRPSRMQELRELQKTLKEAFSFSADLLSAAELRSTYFDSQEVHGGLLHPEHFPIHPMRYVQGLAAAAAKFGTEIYEDSRVLSWERRGASHVLRTARGSVRASHVVVATNGYTDDSLHAATQGRLLNVLSSIIVTQPLTDAQIRECGWKTHMMMLDTRMLRFYFRLLEDNRILFGSRGGVTDTPKNNKNTRRWLIQQLHHRLPALKGIDIDYFWRGWVSLTRDKNPHIASVPGANISYGMGYAGTGVALSSHGGKLLAHNIAQGNFPDIPMLSRPLPRFEMPRLRRFYQRLAYSYYYLKDEYL